MAIRGRDNTIPPKNGNKPESIAENRSLSLDERGALRRLRLNWGTAENQVEFERLVIAHLQAIENVAVSRQDREVPRSFKIGTLSGWASKQREKTKRLRALANRIQSFTIELQDSHDRLSVGDYTSLGPPYLALQSYAAELQSIAHQLEVIAGQRHESKSRNRTRRETWAKLDLVDFVHKNTGSFHLRDLATLLKHRKGSGGLSAAALEQLVNYHRKARGSPRRGLRAAAYRASRTTKG